jgi:hypothetical protein
MLCYRRVGAFFNLTSAVDAVSHLMAPLIRPTADGAMLREVVTHKAVADHQKAAGSKGLPTTRPVPPAKVLPGTCSRLDAIKYLQSHDMHGHIDIAIPHKFALSHNLNALNAHSSYWFSEDVALFVLGQMIVPCAAQNLETRRSPHGARRVGRTPPRRPHSHPSRLALPAGGRARSRPRSRRRRRRGRRTTSASPRRRRRTPSRARWRGGRR